MRVKELLEFRHYGPRPRNKPEAQQEHRDRISKKPTNDKRRRDRLKRRQMKRANVAS